MSPAIQAIGKERPKRHRKTLVAVLAALALLGALLAFDASPAHATTVEGTFHYKDTNPGTGEETDRPTVNAKVEIWRFRSRCFLCPWTWGKDRETRTDMNGSISVDMPFAGNGVVYGMRVFATSDAAVVWPNDAVHTLPFHREPGEDDGQIMHLTEHSASSVLDFSYTFHGWSSQHFNIAEVARHGKAYADALRAPGETDSIPPANFQPTSVTGSYYNAPVDTVVINSDDVNYDYLILHEYAHYLEERISSFAPVPTIHNGCTTTDALGNTANSPELAWMEGFADYFAQAVGRSVPSGTLTGVTGTPGTATLESPSCPGLPNATIPGDAVEDYAAGTLWDVFDQLGDPGSQNETHDTLARMDRQIFEIFDRELDVDGVWPNIMHFRHAWMARNLPGGELSRIMVQLNIPLRENYGPTANAGADQTVEEGTPVTLDGSHSSDPDLNSLNFTWTQVSGPSVTLVNPSSATPSFIAPHPSSGGTTLVFRLVVNDGLAPPSAPDDVTIQVLDTGSVAIQRVTPAEGEMGVARSTNVTAIFSEEMDPATLTTSTVTLVKAGTAMPITATVRCDDLCRTVTLDPSARLAKRTKYTATLKGGATGVKDPSGNTLAPDKVWSFTTKRK